ncbi:hypothetical protein EON68_04330, partial [archaeon]
MAGDAPITSIERTLAWALDEEGDFSKWMCSHLESAAPDARRAAVPHAQGREPSRVAFAPLATHIVHRLVPPAHAGVGDSSVRGVLQFAKPAQLDNVAGRAAVQQVNLEDVLPACLLAPATHAPLEEQVIDSVEVEDPREAAALQLLHVASRPLAPAAVQHSVKRVGAPAAERIVHCTLATAARAVRSAAAAPQVAQAQPAPQVDAARASVPATATSLQVSNSSSKVHERLQSPPTARGRGGQHAAALKFAQLVEQATEAAVLELGSVQEVEHAPLLLHATAQASQTATPHVNYAVSATAAAKAHVSVHAVGRRQVARVASQAEHAVLQTTTPSLAAA